MKACVNKKCKAKYISGTVFDNYCPRCGKKLYDVSSNEVTRLIAEGYYEM